MPPTGDFKAQLGHPENPGLLNQEARLARIRPGRNPYVTGTALPGNSPVFFGRAQILHEILSVLRRPDKPGCVSLLGERRIGKSSLLNQIYQALEQESDLVSIHATAQNWNQKSQQNFFAQLQQVIARAIGQAVQDPVRDYPDFRDFILALAQDHRFRFVLILDDTDQKNGRILAERLCAAVDDLDIWADSRTKLGVSIGTPTSTFHTSRNPGRASRWIWVSS